MNKQDAIEKLNALVDEQGDKADAVCLLARELAEILDIGIETSGDEDNVFLGFA